MLKLLTCSAEFVRCNHVVVKLAHQKKPMKCVYHRELVYFRDVRNRLYKKMLRFFIGAAD